MTKDVSDFHTKIAGYFTRFPICPCPRQPAHRCMVRLDVYPIADGVIAQRPDPTLSMSACDRVVAAYRQGIREGLISAKIDVTDL